MSERGNEIGGIGWLDAGQNNEILLRSCLNIWGVNVCPITVAVSRDSETPEILRYQRSPIWPIHKHVPDLAATLNAVSQSSGPLL